MRSWLLVGAMTATLLLAVACDSGDNGTDGEDTGSGQAADVVQSPDVGEQPSGDVVDGGDDVQQEVTDPLANWPETRLDPVCVGDLCAAGPDNAPDPGAFGPFPVGVRTIEFLDTTHMGSDGQPRWLRAEVWYPTTDDAPDGPLVTYDLVGDAPPERAEFFAQFSDIELDPLVTQAVRDAPVRVSDGPYPLVFFSHGAYGVRFQAAFMTPQLASHGYIVVAPDHEENTTWDIIADGYDEVAVLLSASQRKGDAEYLLDEWVRIAEEDASDFHHVIATDRIGYTGHSFGGFVSLVMGGNDERVRVVVPMAPAANMAALVAGTELGNYKIPVLMMGGDVDRTLDFEPYMWEPYQSISSSKAFLRFYRGGHYTFTDMCSLDVLILADEVGWGEAEDAMTDGCGEENFDPATARDIIAHFAIAMFNTHLRLSPQSEDYIDSSYLEGQEGEVELFLDF